jgi:hypothetical protein
MEALNVVRDMYVLLDLQRNCHALQAPLIHIMASLALPQIA